MFIATVDPKHDPKQPEAAEKTLFVCVRDRHGKGASCAGSGSQAMLAQMREMLAAEGLTEQDLRLQPCGCLGRCNQGPVAMSASGAQAAAKAPPKGKRNRRGRRVYMHIKGRKLRNLLRAVFSEPPLKRR